MEVLLGSLCEGDYFSFPTIPSSLANRYKVVCVHSDCVDCVECWSGWRRCFRSDFLVIKEKTSHPDLD